jgi:hypothetical protein
LLVQGNSRQDRKYEVAGSAGGKQGRLGVAEETGFGPNGEQQQQSRRNQEAKGIERDQDTPAQFGLIDGFL